MIPKSRYSRSKTWNAWAWADTVDWIYHYECTRYVLLYSYWNHEVKVLYWGWSVHLYVCLFKTTIITLRILLIFCTIVENNKMRKPTKHNFFKSSESRDNPVLVVKRVLADFTSKWLWFFHFLQWGTPFEPYGYF